MTWVWRATVEWYIDRGKPKNSEKNLSQCHLSTTNPTWIDPSANPGLRGERPATNDMNHGTAQRCAYYTLLLTYIFNVCSSGASLWRVILSTSSSPVACLLLNIPLEPHQSRVPLAGIFSWPVDCVSAVSETVFTRCPLVNVLKSGRCVAGTCELSWSVYLLGSAVGLLLLCFGLSFCASRVKPGSFRIWVYSAGMLSSSVWQTELGSHRQQFTASHA
jgi:hypothetical protein